MSSGKAKQQYCDTSKCQHWAAVNHSMNGGKKRAGAVAMCDVDWDHMYADHLRICCEYKWKEVETLTAERDQLLAKVARLESQLSAKPAVGAKTTGTLPPVDPANHKDGFCDALMVYKGQEVYKCTETVRYGQNVCPLHVNHKHLIKVEPKTDSK